MYLFLSYRLKRLNRSVRARLTLAFPRSNLLLATPTPLFTMEYSGGMQSKTLIIFLPGIDDLAEDFERRGVIEDMRRQGIVADAVAIDAHYGYYAEKAIFERITDDVITRARAAGYEDIWLAGVSLGGFGAAMYAARHPSHIQGLMLFAPYLGNNALIKEIIDAGGIKSWQPGEIANGNYQRALWAWLKDYLEKDIPALPIYIGYGLNDKFAPANALVAENLPQDRVFAIAGGHDWRTWKKIWQSFLQTWKKPIGEMHTEHMPPVRSPASSE